MRRARPRPGHLKNNLRSTARFTPHKSFRSDTEANQNLSSARLLGQIRTLAATISTIPMKNSLAGNQTKWLGLRHVPEPSCSTMPATRQPFKVVPSNASCLRLPSGAYLVLTGHTTAMPMLLRSARSLLPLEYLAYSHPCARALNPNSYSLLRSRRNGNAV